MIKTILVDDEPIALKHLAAMIEKYNSELKVVTTASSVTEALEQIGIHKPEVVFMDIELGGQNAFEVLVGAGFKDFELVFVSAHSEFGIPALKHGATDYILKPLNKVELINAMDKVVKNALQRRMQKSSTPSEPGRQTLNRLAIPTLEGLVFLDPGKVMYCGAEGRYTRFYTANDNKSILVSKNLGEYEEVLPSGFFIRIHHHYIVNINYIDKYVRGRGGYIVLVNGKNLPVSSRRKDDFFSKLE